MELSNDTGGATREIDGARFLGRIKKKNGVSVSYRTLTRTEAKVIASIPSLEINDTPGRYIVPSHLFMQFTWCAPNSHNVHNLQKVSSYRIIWDKECMIQEGYNLQTDFIEEFNSIIARELRSIKQQGMKAAL